ncbi:MAG TPA: hypothetical protein VF937_14465 [Chloroflexota bacterium]
MPRVDLPTSDFQVERFSIRLAAASAMLGALLALIVNPLHGDLPVDPETALTRVASTEGWSLLHLGIMASVVFLLGGLYGLSQVADGPLARALARLSLVVALPAAAIMLAGIAIDGFATKGLADAWASAPATERATAFRMALAVEEVQNALFHTWAALFIGLPFLLLGVSGLLDGGGFPRWLGLVALVGGAGALLVGIAGFLHLPVPGALFNVFAFIVTLWVLVAGVLVWRAPARPSAALLQARSAA